MGSHVWRWLIIVRSRYSVFTWWKWEERRLRTRRWSVEMGFVDLITEQTKLNHRNINSATVFREFSLTVGVPGLSSVDLRIPGSYCMGGG